MQTKCPNQVFLSQLYSKSRPHLTGIYFHNMGVILQLTKAHTEVEGTGIISKSKSGHNAKIILTLIFHLIAIKDTSTLENRVLFLEWSLPHGHSAISSTIPKG